MCPSPAWPKITTARSRAAAARARPGRTRPCARPARVRPRSPGGTAGLGQPREDGARRVAQGPEPLGGRLGEARVHGRRERRHRRGGDFTASRAAASSSRSISTRSTASGPGSPASSRNVRSSSSMADGSCWSSAATASPSASSDRQADPKSRPGSPAGIESPLRRGNDAERAFGPDQQVHAGHRTRARRPARSPRRSSESGETASRTRSAAARMAGAASASNRVTASVRDPAPRHRRSSVISPSAVTSSIASTHRRTLRSERCARPPRWWTACRRASPIVRSRDPVEVGGRRGRPRCSDRPG